MKIYGGTGPLSDHNPSGYQSDVDLNQVSPSLIHRNFGTDRTTDKGESGQNMLESKVVVYDDVAKAKTINEKIYSSDDSKCKFDQQCHLFQKLLSSTINTDSERIKNDICSRTSKPNMMPVNIRKG